VDEKTAKPSKVAHAGQHTLPEPAVVAQ